MPKISIIIPVRDAQDYLAQCLDSVVSQTLADIEVVCVDDNSGDGSLALLQGYADRDSRVRLISYTENKSASQARKDAVLASTGEYVMFLDADDSIRPDACERLYAAMSGQPVDILHFGTAITNEAGASDERMEWMREFVRPHSGILEGDAVLEGAFSADRLYNFSLWDKLYSADLCKRSFARVKDGRFPKAQDKYAYFILSYFAKTYRGMPEAVLYDYHFGRGVTGHNLLSLQAFERYCSMALVADAIEEFLEAEGALLRHQEVCANTRNELLQDCVANWTNHLGVDDKAAGLDLMLEYWEPTEVVAKTAQLNWTEHGDIARAVQESRALSGVPDGVRVIGTYYHRYANGGVQRVMSILIKLWLELGYEVVLLTDLPPSENDYDLPEGVQRVVLPSSFDVQRSTYIERARSIEAAVAEHGIDVMVYHAWVSGILLWDLLVYKALGVAFVVHCHSVFSQPARSVRPYFAEMPSIYALCDAVVALSEVDQAYWANFNHNVVRVVNPLGVDLDHIGDSELPSKNVLWLGRMSEEKRPDEAFRIFSMVLQEEPDARLIMVGQASDQEYMDGLHSLIAELGIRDSVRLCGFHKDVQPFYDDASVFLMTSEYEGFPQVLSESQAAGVPCVMYGLPYLTITRSRRGFIAVRTGDMNAAADAVVKLLGDDDFRRSLGRDARANVEELARFDLPGAWRGLFEGLSPRVSPHSRDETLRIMWETLHTHYRTGAVSSQLEIRQLRKALAKASRSPWSIRSIRRRARSVVRRIRELRFTQARIIEILAQVTSGEVSVREVCETHGISERTFYRWKRRYGDMSVAETERLRELESENERLKRLLAERDSEPGGDDTGTHVR